jgi:beta-galactosidase
VFGVWSEEIDALPVGQQVSICTGFDSKAERYSAVDFCELIHPTTSKAIAWYDDEFYAGRPAATVNNYGTGRAYYVGSRNDQRFTNQLMTSIMDDLGIEHLAGELPEGVTRQIRYGDAVEYHFYLNATSLSREFETVGWGTVRLQPWQVEILERKISAGDEEPVLLAATEG